MAHAGNPFDDEAMMPTVDDVALWNVTMAL